MPPKKDAKQYPAPRGGSGMTLTLEGNALVAVPFRMKAFTLSTTGRPVAHGYCTVHRSRVKGGPSICDEGGEPCETFSGYELDGKVVEVDTKALGMDSDKSLTLKAIVDWHEIDPLYFEKTYMMWAEPGQEGAFDQIAGALRANGKAAVGTCVMRDATKAVVVRWSDQAGCLVAHACTYDARIQWSEIGEIENGQVMRQQPTAAANKQAAAMLEGQLADTFEFDSVSDEYAAELEAAIEAAAAGVEPPKHEAKELPAPTGDLLAALQAGVAETTKGKPKPKAKPRTRAKAA